MFPTELKALNTDGRLSLFKNVNLHPLIQQNSCMKYLFLTTDMITTSLIQAMGTVHVTLGTIKLWIIKLCEKHEIMNKI